MLVTMNMMLAQFQRIRNPLLQKTCLHFIKIIKKQRKKRKFNRKRMTIQKMRKPKKRK